MTSNGSSFLVRQEVGAKGSKIKLKMTDYVEEKKGSGAFERRAQSTLNKQSTYLLTSNDIQTE